MNGIKRIIRKSKILSAGIKPVFRLARSAVRYPGRKKSARLLLRKLDAFDNTRNHTVWYFGVPTHPNLGDQAQRCCITKWIRKNFPDSLIFEVTSAAFNVSRKAVLEKLKIKIRPDDWIVMQSGYTMTGIHPDEIPHRLITGTFTDNTVLFFPQTIRFVSEKEKQNTVEAIAKNRNVILLTRDKLSFETAKKEFKAAEIGCCPDIVTTEIGNFSFSNERDGILFCMRNDAEQFYERREILRLMERLKEHGRVDLTDTTMHGMKFCEDSDAVWQQILMVIESFSTYRLIVTDRYHGTIFALIAATPVVVLRTNDHKVTSGVEWFRSVYDDYVELADDLEDAYHKANILLSRQYDYKMDNYFAGEYDRMLNKWTRKGEKD